MEFAPVAFNGNGVFLRLFRWATDAANNVDPNAGRFDQEDDNFATGTFRVIVPNHYILRSEITMENSLRCIVSCVDDLREPVQHMNPRMPIRKSALLYCFMQCGSLNPFHNNNRRDL